MDTKPIRIPAPAPAPEGHRIAVVSPDRSVLPGVETFLAPSFQVRLLESASQIIPTMSEFPLDAAILDIDRQGMPPAEALEFLRNLRRVDQDLVLVALTRSRDRNLRLKAAELQVDDFFVAPVDFRELQIVLDRNLEKRALEVENRRVSEQIAGRYSFYDLIGGSEPMRRVYDAILRVARSDTSVVIRGESGTGKELVARAIVAASRRQGKAFVSVNCAALPEALIEAELFGHEKGAFTGAYAARPGQIETAHGGTLFLDEIGTLGLELQSKLLRVLEDRAVTRLGGRGPKKVDFRLLTATNESLEEMVRNGRFRQDLYYRIHVVPIFLPPLRERAGDIPLLVNHFMHLYCATNRVPLKRLDGEALEVLEEYPWKGNVRELENVMQRLVLMVEAPLVTVKDLPQQMLYMSATKQESLLIPEDGIDFEEEMGRIEVAYLEAALRRTVGKKSTAAKLLRIKPQKMKYLCRKYRIGRDFG